MPAATHKYKINQLQSDNSLLTLHPETDAIITLYEPENAAFATSQTITTQPTDWQQNYSSLYYVVKSNGSSTEPKWIIDYKNTSSTFDTNKRYVKCYLTLAGQNITEVDTALDALTVTINDALNDIATNSGVQAIKVGDTSKKGTVEFIGGESGLTTVSIPETGIYANKVVINTLLPTNNSVAISSWNSQSRTLAMPYTITLSTTGDLGSTGSTSITFGTAAFTDYTTDKDDITNSTSSSTIKLPSAYAVQQYVEEKITSGAQYLGTVSAATGGNSPHIKFSSAGVGDWCRATTQFGYWDASTGANTEVHVGDILINTNETVSNKTWDVIHTEVDTDTNTQYQAIVGAAGTGYNGAIILQSKELGASWNDQDTIKFVNGSNITITPNATNKTITIAATTIDTWRPVKVNNADYLDNSIQNVGLNYIDSDTIELETLDTTIGTETWPTLKFKLKNSYQPLDADLTAIAGLTGTTGLLRKTAANTWSLDTNDYITNVGSGLSADEEAILGTISNHVATLGDSGITAGTYSAVQFNAKGIAIAGGNIVEVGTTINGTPSANLAIGGIYYQLIAN